MNYTELTPFKDILAESGDTTIYDFTDIKTKLVYEGETRQLYLQYYENIMGIHIFYNNDITKVNVIPVTNATSKTNYILSEAVQLDPDTQNKFYLLGTDSICNPQLATMLLGESCTFNDITISAADTTGATTVIKWYKINGRIQAEYCPYLSLSTINPEEDKKLKGSLSPSNVINSGAFTGFSLGNT